MVQWTSAAPWPRAAETTMHVLFVASRPPYPPLQGDRVRAYHFLRHLVRRHRVTLVAPVTARLTPEVQAANAALAERWVPVRIPRRWWVQAALRYPFSARPLQTLLFAAPSLLRAVQALVAQHAFDLVHVQLARLGPVAEVLPPQLPRVLDFIDALSLNMARRAAREPWPQRGFFLLEARRMARYERALVQVYTQQVVTSTVDRAAIGDFPTLHVIPNGVDVDAFPFYAGPREPGLIVFTGRMGYFPNEEAAVFFATQVFPQVRRAVPHARFVIVGADPTPRVQRLARLPGVEVTGFVPRVQDYLQRAQVAVAPMRSGTGIQNKVLEAMAAGAAVVATPQALGGIAARSGEHLLVAEDAAGLAAQVVRVLQDPTLGPRLARAARAWVETHHSWARATAQLEAVYQAARQVHARAHTPGAEP